MLSKIRKPRTDFKEMFIKNPRIQLKKDDLYKARHHPKQKTLKLKKYYRGDNDG